jgi:hypothetical protein
MLTVTGSDEGFSVGLGLKRSGDVKGPYHESCRDQAASKSACNGGVSSLKPGNSDSSRC